MAEVAGPGKEFVDPLRPLVGILTFDEGTGFRGRRDSANNVEREAAKELRIVGKRGRRDAVLGPKLVELAIDGANDLIQATVGADRLTEEELIAYATGTHG